MQEFAVVPTQEAHFPSLYTAFDSIARERRYLAFLQAPPKEAAWAFYRHLVDADLCHFVAVHAGQVVGWCDILPLSGEARAHAGTLGMGVIAGYRRQGLGRRLIQAALAKAHAQGMSRIELSVRTDNLAAKTLYERVGFAIEGVQRNALQIDGQNYDAYCMALLAQTGGRAITGIGHAAIGRSV